MGTQTPRATLVGTVRYLLENHDLLNSLTLPWRLDDEPVIRAESPPDSSWIALENATTAVFVRPIDDPVTARSCIEALAEVAGLRVMFQGDW